MTQPDPGVTLKDGTQFCAPRTPGAPTARTLPEDSTMAKALLGHLGGTDPRMLEQVRLLNRRVADLEAHVMRLQAENDHLVAAVHDGRLLTVDEALREPASV
ncbi:hypothetical protein GCM10009554_00760 [Kribbella koreensis]|uniref:Uncharacterized protein n=4 Tax=Kribbellaceae TaxID=2726069 RepID=A0ABP6X7H2_9ACTN